MYEKLLVLCEKINGVVWGPFTVAFFIFTGVYFTLGTNFFQARRFKLWMQKTLFSIFTKSKSGDKDKKTISQFQAAATALAASVGTGNIVGVATAIVLGGPGAVLWMVVSAFFCMMTSFAENVLGAAYRFKGKDGRWHGGPMVYIEKAGGKLLGCIFAFFCIMASFGIGNMSQINSISESLLSAFDVPAFVSGAVFSVLTALVVIGGVKRIARVAEVLVPAMVVFYMVAAVICIVVNYHALPGALKLIFGEAFKIKSVACGVAGYGIREAMFRGVSRGVFSNEAGLGTSVIAHLATSECKSTDLGMWGIFEVFLDTVIVCTVTALVILTSGVYNMGEYMVQISAGESPVTGAVLSVNAFENTFGSVGGGIIAISIMLFAFASIIGWCYYGEVCTEYLLGRRAVAVYKIIFAAFVFVGAVMDTTVVWSISDIFNGLMAFPNLIALIILSGEVLKTIKRERL